MPLAHPLLVAALAVLHAAGPPDLAPPGMKTVTTRVMVELDDAAGNLRIAGMERTGHVRELAPGDSVTVHAMRKVTLFALGPSDELPPKGGRLEDEPWLEDRPHVELPIRRFGNVGMSSPIAAVVHHVRVTGVEGDTVLYELRGTSYFDADGQPVAEGLLRALCIGLAVVGVAGLVVLARRRAPATEATA